MRHPFIWLLIAVTSTLFCGSGAALAQEGGPPPPSRAEAAGAGSEIFNLRVDQAQHELEKLISSKLKSGFDASGYGLTTEEKKALRQLESAISSNNNEKARAALLKARGAAQGQGAKFVLGALQLQLGEKLLDAGMQSEGTDLLIDSGTAPASTLPVLYKNQGMFALDANNLAKAEEAFGKVVELVPGDADTAVILAQVKNDLGKHEEALTLFERAVAVKTAAKQDVPAVWTRAAESTRRIVLRKAGTVK